MATSTRALLERIAPEIEGYLRPRLVGFLGSFVRAYLPQRWVFETEDGATTVTILPDGRVTVGPGAEPPADVTVHAPRATLDALLAERRRPPGVPPDVRVTAHSSKGRAALEQVRGRFGL